MMKESEVGYMHASEDRETFSARTVSITAAGAGHLFSAVMLLI